MSNAVVLERVQIPKRPKASEETKQLARDAKLILGYDDLADDVLGARERLCDVLRRLQIQPFSSDSVERYKEQKREQLQKKTGKYGFYWDSNKLQNCKGVPLFVLHKAIEIKRAAPDVKIFVVSLNRDPFLKVELDGEGYYVEVWDEADFEKTL